MIERIMIEETHQSELELVVLELQKSQKSMEDRLTNLEAMLWLFLPDKFGQEAEVIEASDVDLRSEHLGDEQLYREKNHHSISAISQASAAMEVEDDEQEIKTEGQSDSYDFLKIPARIFSTDLQINCSLINSLIFSCAKWNIGDNDDLICVYDPGGEMFSTWLSKFHTQWFGQKILCVLLGSISKILTSYPRILNWDFVTALGGVCFPVSSFVCLKYQCCEGEAETKGRILTLKIEGGSYGAIWEVLIVDLESIKVAEIQYRDVLVWTTTITGHSQGEHMNDALWFFSEIQLTKEKKICVVDMLGFIILLFDPGEIVVKSLQWLLLQETCLCHIVKLGICKTFSFIIAMIPYWCCCFQELTIWVSIMLIVVIVIHPGGIIGCIPFLYNYKAYSLYYENCNFCERISTCLVEGGSWLFGLQKEAHLKILFNLHNLLETPYNQFYVYFKALNLAVNGEGIEHVIPSFAEMDSFLNGPFFVAKWAIFCCYCTNNGLKCVFPQYLCREAKPKILDKVAHLLIDEEEIFCYGPSSMHFLNMEEVAFALEDNYVEVEIEVVGNISYVKVAGEDWSKLSKTFPNIQLEDKLIFDGGSIDMNRKKGSGPSPSDKSPGAQRVNHLAIVRGRRCKFVIFS
ncbi:eukaryotic translation initiation factor 3 subunit M-like [Senna tora]|uniref:Eukaryotic translation initiation factor 3 subunit M-like n=1 Tax=Senna tora TaxID=362788 RepID=A0A834TTS6_9FABA|nr:eukaryotic translation initiation factor 3 subunit M-like [Senna tora]